MSAPALSLAPYRLALARPLRVGGVEVAHRDGLVVSLRDAQGHVGYGDACPLPGLHGESLAEARAWLEGVVLPEGGELGALRRRILEAGGAPASAWFALESAFVTLEAARRGTTPARVLSDAPLARVPVNALFDGDSEAARAAIDAGAFEGYTAIKVKLARRDPAEERRLLAVLDEELPASTRLRLDFNQGLGVAEAAEILEPVSRERIEYVEEPVAEARLLEAFHARTGLRVALDELLRTDEAGSLVALPFVSTLVLKPSLRGGVMETLADADQARAAGKEVVLSSTFESGLGLAFLAQLAASVMNAGVAAGLGTDAWLADDTIRPPFDSSSGVLDVSTWGWTLDVEPPA